MDDKPNRGAEAFNIGAVAVESTDQPVNPPKIRLGAVAVKHSSEPLVESDEEVVTIIHRHLIGIVGIYIEMLVAIATVIVVVAMAIGGVFGNLPAGSNGLIVGGAVLIIGLLAALLLISTYVYRQCRIIVTDKSLVTVVQKAMFIKKISRLSMSNVEDVTAEQRGLLATMFNFGTLTIQTAGEEDNFIFPLCPKPNDIAEQILDARQAHVR